MSEENKKSGLNIVSSDEFLRDSGDTLFLEGPKIADWPDFKFTSPDGRVFGFFENGESIGKRLQARDIGINKYDRERLENTAGMIIVTVDDVPDDPMIFGEEEPLAIMWLKLHKSHGVPLSEDERARFGLEPDEELGDDEE
jgi:hypothetical protein